MTAIEQGKTKRDRFWELVGKYYAYWSPVAVGAIGLLFIYIKNEANTYDIASSIFQVSGTIVALILPASEIANNSIRVFTDEMLVRITSENDVCEEKRIKITNSIANELKEHLIPAWRGSLYALFSFFLSSILMFAPLGTIKIFCQIVYIDSLFLGFAFGFLIVGALLFFPTAWYTYSLRSLKNAQRVVEAALRSTAVPVRAGSVDPGPQAFEDTPTGNEH